MSAPSMNIAVWGLGRHAFKTVLPVLAMERRLVGVFSRNTESRCRAEVEYGCRSWSDESAMLDDATVDTVYLATPVGTHFEQGMRVLAAGRGLLCEKSLTEDRYKSLKMIAAARHRDLLLCETFIYQFHPRILALADMVREGVFGRVVTVMSAFHLPQEVPAGYRNDPTLGGGALLDVACYPLSLLNFLGFDHAWVADGSIFRPEGSSVDIAGVARVGLAGSGQALLSWGYGAAYRNEATVIGERGSITIEHVFTKGGPPCMELQLRDVHGGIEVRRYAVADGTKEMIDYASRARITQSMKMELWQRAEQQAHLMHELQQFALT